MLEYDFQWLNVLLRSIQLEQGLVEVRRNMVDPTQAIPIHNTDIELWPGAKFVIYRSLNGIKMVADKVFAVFRTRSLLQLYQNSHNQDEFLNDLKFSFVITKHTKRVLSYRVFDIIRDKTPATAFITRRVVKTKTEEGSVEPKSEESKSAESKSDESNTAEKKESEASAEQPEKEDGEAPAEPKSKSEDVEVSQQSLYDYYLATYDIAVQKDQPLVVCRPTGRGSTRVALLPLELIYATGLFLFIFLSSFLHICFHFC